MSWLSSAIRGSVRSAGRQLVAGVGNQIARVIVNIGSRAIASRFPGLARGPAVSRAGASRPPRYTGSFRRRS